LSTPLSASQIHAPTMEFARSANLVRTSVVFDV
jgi:hypothetical protein